MSTEGWSDLEEMSLGKHMDYAKLRPGTKHKGRENTEQAGDKSDSEHCYALGSRKSLGV